MGKEKDHAIPTKQKLILFHSNVSISNVMLGGDERSLGHCGSDIVCVGFSWNDRGGGGGQWKIYLIIHCYISHWTLEDNDVSH